MANAFILFGGKVKQSTNVTASTFNNKSGYVQTMVINGIKYTHVFTQTNGGSTITAGYYQEAPFLDWLVTKNPVSDLNNCLLGATMLADAVKGDTVIVSNLKMVSPYTDFCTINHYSWPYNPSVDPIDGAGNIVFPSPLPVPTTVRISLLEPAAVFFNNNITLITSSDFQDNKDDAAYSLALCALFIQRINSDIFPFFNSIPSVADYIANQNGYWEGKNIFNQPTYEDILQYEESLANYYNAVYNNQVYIKNQTDGNKLIWFASVLDASGLAVFPLDTKIKLLGQMLQIISQASPIVDAIATTITNGIPLSVNPNNKIAALGPQLILNIVDSIVDVPTQTDSFLTQLLKTNYTNTSDSDQTLFESLYNLLSDNRIGRYTYGGINTNNNRKHFVYSIYSIWRISKFNPKYNSPDYTQPVNPSGVFPEAFFIANHSTYYNSGSAPGVLAYISPTPDIASYVVNFSYAFGSQAIIVTKTSETEITDKYTYTLDNGVVTFKYHFFQPLTITGYNKYTNLHLPKDRDMPAFYLKYAFDAKNEADFDNGIFSFSVFAFNAALNLTGLVGALDDMAYLTEVTEAAEASTLPSSTFIAKWEKFLGAVRVVTFTAGSFSALVNYVKDQKENSDPKVQAFLQKIDTFLSVLTLAAATIDITSQLQTSYSALDLIDENAAVDESDRLPPGVMEEVEKLGNLQDLLDRLNQKLSSLPNIPTNENTIITKFATITDPDEQLNFFNQFYFIDDDDPIWIEYNTIYTPDASLGLQPRTLIDDWIEITRPAVKEKRNDINFMRYYRDRKYLDRSQFNHIILLKKNNGGHVSDFVSTDFSDGKLWKIVPLGSGINTTIPDGFRTITTEIKTTDGSHFFYENVWRYNPNLDPNNPEVYLLEGKTVSRKGRHFAIADKWAGTDGKYQVLFEEMAYAESVKGDPISSVASTIIDDQGQSIPITISYYDSSFSDKTPVELTVSSQAIDINGKLKSNYTSLLAIKKP